MVNYYCIFVHEGDINVDDHIYSNYDKNAFPLFKTKEKAREAIEKHVDFIMRYDNEVYKRNPDGGNKPKIQWKNDTCYVNGYYESLEFEIIELTLEE